MTDAEVLIVGLLVAIAGLGGLARLLSVPYPVVLVLGGAVLGFVPGLPQVELDPDVVLAVFLPPLLYGAGVFANFHDFRSELRWVALNAVPLVLVTMTAVAVAAHALVAELPWAAAFVLGAIVSPTDPLAAGAIMRRLGVPRRMVSVVEGEGLFNDATALVAYRVAVAAVVTGSFSQRTPACSSLPAPPAASRSASSLRGSSPRSADGCPTTSSTSPSRCSPATPRSCPPTPSAPPACSPRSPPGSSWASAARSCCPSARACRATTSGTRSTSSSTRRCSC